ncbi:hypothetical protein M2432_000883 [Mycobacterium sp. OTB74]|nr:hypothetical protein [Mycobacterium sp. OTB74]
MADFGSFSTVVPPADTRLLVIEASLASMRIAIVALGVVVTLFGLLFALQGLGAVHGSPMTNTTTWSVLGPIIALVGIGIAFTAWRWRKP